MDNQLSKLYKQVASLESRLQTLKGSSKDNYLDSVSKAFPLGMVGGSGRNTARLNRRREQSLDKTISNASETIRLERDLKYLKAKIADLEAGGPQARKESREQTKQGLAEKEKAERKAMTPQQRLFIGNFPGGIVYCDRSVLKGGDYKRVAFLSRSTRKLEWNAKRIDQQMKELIEQDAATNTF